MSETEISDLLNEYRETSVDRRLGASPAPYAHPQQTDQISSKKIESPRQRSSTPSLGQTEPRNPTKKPATIASAFTVHEDQPGTRSSVKVSNPQRYPRCDFSSSSVCLDATRPTTSNIHTPVILRGNQS